MLFQAPEKFKAGYIVTGSHELPQGDSRCFPCECLVVQRSQETSKVTRGHPDTVRG